MTSRRQPPTERTAWLVFGLSLLTAVLSAVSSVLGEGSPLAVLTLLLSALGAGTWLGRILEARAVRSGRNALRLPD